MAPRLSRAEAHARLVGPGLPFELEEIRVRDVVTRTWKNAPPSLGAVLAASTAYGERPFLVLDDKRLSYADHHRLACRFAQALRERYGVRPGERVAIAMRNLPDWSVAFWAATAIGAIAVPLNAWLVADELAYCIADSGACLAVADGPRADLLAGCGQTVGLRGIVVVRGEGAEDRRGIARWEDVLAGADPAPGLPDAGIAPDDDATIFYTSGTTGTPKGAVGTHRNLIANIMTVAYRGAVRQLCRGETPVWLGGPQPHPVTLVPVPFFHVTGCHSIMAPGLFGGSTLVLMHRWDPEHALALGERERVTNITGVPGMVLQMLESPRFAAHDTSSLIAVNYGGTPPPPRLLERIDALLPGADAENGYGLTEASSLVSYNAGESYRRHPDGAGVPTPICDLRIVDEAGAALPAGARGEVCVKGPNIVRGYWKRPEASAETFRDGWLHTGDIGLLDADGCLFLLDRAKDMLIRGGENVYCVEVENALCTHPQILDAAVIGKPHPVLGQEVAAVVQVRAGERGGRGGADRALPGAARGVQGAGGDRRAQRSAARQRQRQGGQAAAPGGALRDRGGSASLWRRPGERRTIAARKAYDGYRTGAQSLSRGDGQAELPAPLHGAEAPPRERAPTSSRPAAACG